MCDNSEERYILRQSVDLVGGIWERDTRELVPSRTFAHSRMLFKVFGSDNFAFVLVLALPLSQQQAHHNSAVDYSCQSPWVCRPENLTLDTYPSLISCVILSTLFNFSQLISLLEKW